MRLALALPLIALLAGCSGSSSGSGPSAKPSATTNAVARVATIPPSTAPPIKGEAHPPTINPHVTPHALPTTPPVNYPTPTPFPPSAYTAVIHGTVTDGKSHSPIAGAIIVVGVPQAHHIAHTNAFGEYRITFPAGPPVPVQVSANGFEQALAMGNVRAHSSLTVNFRLSRVVLGKPVAPPPPSIFGSP